MTSLSSEVAGICAWNYSSSPTGIEHFLIIAAPAFNGDATVSQRRRDLTMRQVSYDSQGHALLDTSGVSQPAALDVETHRSVDGGHARSMASRGVGPSAISSIPSSETSLSSPADTYTATPQPAIATPSPAQFSTVAESSAAAPDPISIIASPQDTPQPLTIAGSVPVPGSSGSTVMVASLWAASGASVLATAVGYSTGVAFAVSTPLSTSIQMSQSVSIAALPTSILSASIVSSWQSGSSWQPASLSYGTLNESLQSTATATETKSSGPASTSSQKHGSASDALSAAPGTLLVNVDYWCLFTMGSQEWYCGVLLAIAAATLAAALAVLRFPVSLDASCGPSMANAVAHSVTACRNLKKRDAEIQHLRGFRKLTGATSLEDSKLVWASFSGDRPRLYATSYIKY